jgi:hypothetical protein
MKPKNPLKLDGAGPLSDKAIDALEHLDASRRDFLKTAGVMMIGFGAAATTGRGQSNPQAMLITLRSIAGSQSAPTAASQSLRVSAISARAFAPYSFNSPLKNWLLSEKCNCG